MDMAPLALTGTQTAALAQPPPRMTPDLRPVADSAALVHDARHAGSTSSILPAPLAQVAEVSRNLLATAQAEGPPAVARGERVLKPWGVTMLPATDDDAPRAPPARDGMAEGAAPDGGEA